MISVLALVSTIPVRRRSCQRLLAELAQQSRIPDGVILCLDGYGEDEAPSCPLPIEFVRRTPTLSGAGQRWLFVEDLLDSCPSTESIPDDAIMVNFDDDMMLAEAPNFVRALVDAVEIGGGAAAAAGRTHDGKPAPPGNVSRGRLMYGGGHGLTVRARYLRGLRAFAKSVRAAGGPDALGVGGDDDALVSAFLHKEGVHIIHATAGNTFAAPGTQTSSQSAAKRARGEATDAQKQRIKKITGWPWKTL